VSITTELKRITMGVNSIAIDLPETCHLPLDLSVGQQPGTPIALDLQVERNLSARKQAHRYVGLSDCRKSAVLDSRNLVVTSLSPTLAGRCATWSKL
jgi:hypothetical protein